MRLLLGATLLLHCASVLGGVVFTGNSTRDFNDPSFDPESGRPHDFGVVQVWDAPTDASGAYILPALPDVGLPPQFPVTVISGWDIRSIYWQYDDIMDQLNIGMDCFGICGDADGDGDAGRTSATLAAIGGLDLPNLAQSESFVIAIDLNLDVADVLPSFVPNLIVPFDYILGIPGGQPSMAEANPGPGEVPLLPCSIGQSGNDLFGLQQCFGLYNYQLTAAVPLARRMQSLATTANGTAWPTSNYNPNNVFDWPTAAQPHLEWIVGQIANLRATKGAGFTRSNKEPWSLLIQAFSGSFQDAGVGEDYVPSQVDYDDIQFPCLQLDACDVCLGDNSTCLDCAGIPNGPNAYDACDICGGNNKECVDCAGVPNGPATYDVCDVCNGDGSHCRDCAGVPNGPNTYDVCDICAGSGTTCFDCAGIVNGPTTYDKCDVCGGDSTTCLDCARVPNGPSVYDKCDVCGGDSTTCLDCLGQPNGPAVYDLCDVCNGMNTACRDCLGVPNGPHVYDVCDICNGDGNECNDCAGVPLGSCQYDACDVCCGDGTTCLDCADTPFGTCKYDNCGVCCGDGSSCVCLKINGCPVDEVDYALLQWTLVASIDRIDNAIDVLQGIEEELCRYDVDRGNLASDIAGYLNSAIEFRTILDNYCYVQLWFKDTIDEALQTI